MQRVCVCTCLPVNAPMVAVLLLTMSQVLLCVIITAMGCDALDSSASGVPDRLALPVTAETWPGPTGQSVQSRWLKLQGEVLVSVHCECRCCTVGQVFPGVLVAAGASLLRCWSVLIPMAVGTVLFFQMQKPQPRGGGDSGG